MIINLENKNSIINTYLMQLRDSNIQKDAMRFRKNLKRISSMIGYEISKSFEYNSIEVETPLGIANGKAPVDKIVLSTILRAGLPMHEGLLDVFDDAENAFISAFRMHHKDGTFEINMGYISCPDIENKILILCDPMLATGSSIEIALNELSKYGKPKKIHVVVAVSSKDGIEYLNRKFNNIDIWTGAIDEELTARSYIVPGLGDAGDLAFGVKLQE